MKLCGLTGGVGMGKSTAAGFFLQHGMRVIDTDDLARHLVQSGQPALNEIRTAFGEVVFDADGQLRRGKLAEIVFGNKDARLKLEAILHPKIREAWLNQIGRWREESCPMAMVVIPLLFETQAEEYFDKIICVACSSSSQHVRLAGRGWSSGQISQRIAAQMPIEQKIVRSHHILWTEGNLASHEQQVPMIFSRL